MLKELDLNFLNNLYDKKLNDLDKELAVIKSNQKNSSKELLFY